jgi:hypothetical protein
MSDDLTSGAGSTAGDAGQHAQPVSTGAATPAAQTVDERRFTQADLDRVVSERLARERDAEKERTRKAAEQAKEQERIKAGELQAVAEERAAKLADLEPKVETLTATVETRDKLIEKLIEPRIKALSEEFRSLLPDGDIAARVETLIKVEKAAEKAAQTRNPGTPGGPRGSGSPAPLTTVITAKRVGDGF